MNLIEKLQKAHDSMKSHETVTVELDWFEVCRLLAMEKASEVYDKSLEESLLGVQPREVKSNELKLYIGAVSYERILKNDKSISINATNRRLDNTDITIIINENDVELYSQSEDKNILFYKIKNTKSLNILIQ